MERRGLHFDLGVNQRNLERALKDKEALSARWEAFAPGINADSPAQLSKFLYETRGWPLPPISGTLKAVKRRDPEQEPTGEAALHWLANKARNPQNREALLNLAKLRKVTRLSQFLEKLPHHVVDGVIYASFGPDTETGRLSCVASDALIEMPRDMLKHPHGVPITEVKAGDWVYAYDWRRELTLRRVTWVGQTGVRETVSVVCENQHGHRLSLRLTPEHLVRLYNGDWRPAGSLQRKHGAPSSAALPRITSMVSRGSGRVPDTRTGHSDYRVISVDPGLVEPVWDMEVEEDHNFIANGICVHNCRNPNLQQIPAKEPYGIRKAFVAPPGEVLVVGDWEQLELYVMAHFLEELFEDESLKRALLDGDVYTNVAHEAWPETRLYKNLKHADDPKMAKLRDMAKIVVLGKNYGKTINGLALQLGVSKEEAAKLDASYVAAFPGVPRFQVWAQQEALTRGHTRTIFGRRRDIDGADSQEAWKRARAARQAANGIIQGSAADICMEALRGSSGLSVRLQVHDELVVSSPEADTPNVAGRLQRIMESGVSLRCPLKAEVKTAPNWGSVKG